MKTYANPTATVIRLDAMDVIATSGEPNYIELRSIKQAGRPDSNRWEGLGTKEGF